MKMPPQKRLMATLKFLEEFVSEDPTHPNISRISISADGKTLVATDGHRLAMVALIEPLPTEGTGNALGVDSLGRMKLGLLPLREEVPNFPDYARLLPKRRESSSQVEESWPAVIGFNGRLLGDTLSGLAALGRAWELPDMGGVRVQWGEQNAPLRVEFGEVKDAPIRTVCVVMPMRIIDHVALTRVKP